MNTLSTKSLSCSLWLRDFLAWDPVAMYEAKNSGKAAYRIAK